MERKEIDREEIEIRFTYHIATGTQAASYEVLRSVARDLALEILKLVPESRERYRAITRLEEALMWANAGIARRG